MEWIATLVPQTASDPLKTLASPPAGTALVELRLDLFPDLDPALAVAACPLPVLATLRSQAEGGAGPEDPTARGAALGAAAEAGAALLDLEFDRDQALVGRLGLTPDQIVMSWHDPAGTPPDLAQRAAAMLAHPARWIKLVTTARSLADMVRIIDLHAVHNLASRRHRRRLIAFAMGAVGQPSRYLAPLLGPPLCYVPWHGDAPAAPGQVSRERLEGAIGHLAGPPQRLFLVVGADTTASLSPVLYGAGFAAAGLHDLLVPVSVPDVAELDGLFVSRGRSLLDRAGLEIHGLAVTSPYKRQAAAAATIAAPRVRRAAAANTLVPRLRQLLADTTDADGVVGALTARGVDPAGRTAIVQGTGGAARAAAVGLDLAGAAVALRGRDTDRTRDTARALEVEWTAPDSVVEADILVNATPLGSDPGDRAPFAADELRVASTVLEMVYRDHPTALEQLCHDAGIACISGREMLLHQGLAQFAAFTTSVPPRAAMRHALGLTVDAAQE